MFQAIKDQDIPINGEKFIIRISLIN